MELIEAKQGRLCCNQTGHRAKRVRIPVVSPGAPFGDVFGVDLVHKVVKMHTAFLGMGQLDGIEEEAHDKSLPHADGSVDVEASWSRVGRPERDDARTKR